MFAQVVILLVLLTWWLDIPKNDHCPYQIIELFAGVGRIAALGKYAGYTSAAVDIEYNKQAWDRAGKRSPYDINADSGLVPLVCIVVGDSLHH